jgi:hypothetical protein
MTMRIVCFLAFTTLEPSCTWQLSKRLVAAQELNAIRGIGEIRQAEEAYIRSHGQAGSAVELAIPQHVTGGYTFELTVDKNRYVIKATPEQFGATGRRSFYADESGIIHQSWDPEQPADSSSPSACGDPIELTPKSR